MAFSPRRAGPRPSTNAPNPTDTNASLCHSALRRCHAVHQHDDVDWPRKANHLRSSLELDRPSRVTARKKRMIPFFFSGTKLAPNNYLQQETDPSMNPSIQTDMAMPRAVPGSHQQSPERPPAFLAGAPLLLLVLVARVAVPSLGAGTTRTGTTPTAHAPPIHHYYTKQSCPLCAPRSPRHIVFASTKGS